MGASTPSGCDTDPVPIEPLPTSDARSEWVPDRVGASLDRLLGSLGGARSATVSGLHQRWDEVVGSAIAAHTRPLRVRDGVLLVATDDPAWAAELRWLGDELAAQARDVLGDPSIERIEVRVEATRT